MGDFNAIADGCEKWGGNPNLNVNSRGFRQFIFEAGLMDLGYNGPAYTWSNKQSASDAIYERLDRVLATVSWVHKFSQASVHNLPHIHSDHSSVLLRLRRQTEKVRSFKVENWWLSTPGFHEMCGEAWSSTAGQEWRVRVQVLSSQIKHWADEQQTPKRRLNTIRQQILSHQIQHPLNQEPGVEERLLADYRKAEEDLAIYWRQRSRVQWQCEGDMNTSFFHMMATQRRRGNSITQIQQENGFLVTDAKEIRRVFVRYFKRLYCSSQSLGIENDPAEFFERFDAS
ncbi:uncharacterized protein LOC144552516 [Carex rostrata]